MDFGRILTRAWEITWRWKVLWILGFLVGLGGGGGNFGNSGYRFGSQDMSTGQPNFNFPTIPTAVMGLIVALGCLAVIAGIALAVLSIIARGGLIAGVVQAEDEGTVSLGRAWQTGVHRFWTLFGISVLVAIPIIVVAVIGAVAVVAALVPAFSTSSAGGAPPYLDRNAPLIAGVVLCGCTLICLLAIVAAVLSQIQVYAERAAILEGLGWTAAFRRGWQVLREHLGPTLILWLIFLALGLVFGIVTLIILSPLLIPLAAIAGRGGEAAGGWWVALCGGGLIAIVVGAVINSVVQVFTSASWTLAYRSLVGGATAAPPAPPTPVAPVVPDAPAEG